NPLYKATNPSNRNEDWEYIIGFCDQINKELEGPQIAVRLLAHKIQSPQEWEAIQALTVLEACMKNCGRRFHNEVGKFRFLNELIKVVSPKVRGKPWNSHHNVLCVCVSVLSYRSEHCSRVWLSLPD
uniref:Golgi associated, gamma adaptin ear containing, ARF binding protein 3a n=1 Tax=Scleropages formosus TaxID=113540 RepID=A0A8C9U191_SCLFO